VPASPALRSQTVTETGADPEVPIPSVAIVTLGCGRNEVDSDQLAGLFHREGNRIVDDPAAADVVLVNTCTFIAPAKQESIDTVLEACQLKEDGQARAVLVVGCMAQRYPQELADAIPEADAIVGFDGYAALPRVVDDVLAGRTRNRVIGVGEAHPGSRPTRRDLPLVALGSSPSTAATEMGDLALGLAAIELPPEAPRVDTAATVQDGLDRVPATGPRFPMRLPVAAGGVARPWSYLKIASGCDRLCTFCAIPSFRGRFRSRPLDEIVAEAAWLAEQGARELVLVSENTTSWGKDLPGGRGLQPALLRELAAVDGVERLRLMYLQPAELTTSLLEAMAAEEKVASYFDLSLQHVSGPVVRRMARSGDHERFGALIDRIRALDPHAVFRSNFIVGFPGETEEDVATLERFLEQHLLDWVGLFAFSSEDGTPSAHLPDQIPPELARERLARVSELQERLADEAARRFVGRELEVTVQEVVDEGGRDEGVAGWVGPDGAAVTVGRSYREAPDTDGEVQLVTPGGSPVDVPVGRTVTASVVDAVGVDLIARVETATAGAAGPGGPRG
jgi:ribosomal protein S12 methylthiotransferase